MGVSSISLLFVSSLILILTILSSSHIGDARERQQQQQLPISHISVSGFSDGAFFASQFHVAFSATVKGVGMFSGGPYYCAEGYHPQANTSCESGVPPISVMNLISEAKGFAADGLIDDLGQIADARVYLFTGTQDEVHTTVVARAASEFYTNFTSNVKIVDDVQAGHCIPSNSSLSAPCNSTSFPYFNNCGYDAVVDMFNYIYNINPNNSKTADTMTNGTHIFTQNSTSVDKMAPTGAYYLPTACENSTCPLHVFFHSQDQGSLLRVAVILLSHQY